MTIQQDREQLVSAIAVTLELTGMEMTPEARAVLVDELLPHGVAMALHALQRVRRECRGRFSLADVMARLDDGRPTADQAWAMLPVTEEASVVWTDEMARASGVSQALRGTGDQVGARLAFCREYDRLVADARALRRPVRWWPSLGWDKAGRIAVLNEGVQTGRITAAVRDLLVSPDSLPEPVLSERIRPLLDRISNEGRP